jgi:hypothetical protein
MDITLKPVLERMREMQRTAEQFNAPISMSAADYKDVADEIEKLQRIVEDAKDITNWHGQHAWRKRHGMPNSLRESCGGDSQ